MSPRATDCCRSRRFRERRPGSGEVGPGSGFWPAILIWPAPCAYTGLSKRLRDRGSTGFPCNLDGGDAMAVRRYYRLILQTLQGKTNELRNIPPQRLDWAGP